jgi:hypothetical protein
LFRRQAPEKRAEEKRGEKKENGKETSVRAGIAAAVLAEDVLRQRSTGQKPSAYVFSKEDGGSQLAASAMHRDVLKELGFNDGP